MSVSVVMAAFNADKSISRAIHSALAQTSPPLEIIVVDDASTDNTCDVVNEVSKQFPCVRLVEVEVNKGPSYARNMGIQSARGDWIAILDADDAWKSARLERLVTTAEQLRADFIADNQIFYDAAVQIEGRLGFAVDWKYKALDIESLFANDILDRRKPAYPPMKPLIRRDFLLSLGIGYDETVRYGEDFKFYAELLFNGARAVLVSDAYYIYSTRTGEFSGANSEHSKSLPRFDLLTEMSDELSKKYRDRIPPPLARVIAVRREQLRLIHLSNIARTLRRTKRYKALVIYLFKQPDLIWFLSKRLSRRLLAAVQSSRLTSDGS
jgi:succinoglycan biosynthesis protein ExoO